MQGLICEAKGDGGDLNKAAEASIRREIGHFADQPAHEIEPSKMRIPTILWYSEQQLLRLSAKYDNYNIAKNQAMVSLGGRHW